MHKHSSSVRGDIQYQQQQQYAADASMVNPAAHLAALGERTSASTSPAPPFPTRTSSRRRTPSTRARDYEDLDRPIGEVSDPRSSASSSSAYYSSSSPASSSSYPSPSSSSAQFGRSIVGGRERTVIPPQPSSSEDEEEDEEQEEEEEVSGIASEEEYSSSDEEEEEGNIKKRHGPSSSIPTGVVATTLDIPPSVSSNQSRKAKDSRSGVDLAHGHYVNRFYRLLESKEGENVMTWIKGDTGQYDRFKVLSWDNLWKTGVVKTNTRACVIRNWRNYGIDELAPDVFECRFKETLEFEDETGKKRIPVRVSILRKGVGENSIERIPDKRKHPGAFLYNNGEETDLTLPQQRTVTPNEDAVPKYEPITKDTRQPSPDVYDHEEEEEEEVIEEKTYEPEKKPKKKKASRPPPDEMDVAVPQYDPKPIAMEGQIAITLTLPVQIRTDRWNQIILDVIPPIHKGNRILRLKYIESMKTKLNRADLNSFWLRFEFSAAVRSHHHGSVKIKYPTSEMVEVIPPMNGISPVAPSGRSTLKVLFKKRPKMATGKSSAILFMKAIIYDSNGDVASQSPPFELVFKGGVNDCRFSEQSASPAMPMASLTIPSVGSSPPPLPPSSGVASGVPQDWGIVPHHPTPKSHLHHHPQQQHPSAWPASYKGPLPLPDMGRSPMEIESKIPTMMPTPDMDTISSTRVRKKYHHLWQELYPPTKQIATPVVILFSNKSTIWLKNGQEWVLDKDEKYYIQFHFPPLLPNEGVVVPFDYNAHYNTNTNNTRGTSTPTTNYKGEESFAKKRKRALSSSQRGTNVVETEDDLRAAAAQLSMLSSTNTAPSSSSTSSSSSSPPREKGEGPSASSGEPSAKKAKTEEHPKDEKEENEDERQQETESGALKREKRNEQETKTEENEKTAKKDKKKQKKAKKKKQRVLAQDEEDELLIDSGSEEESEIESESESSQEKENELKTPPLQKAKEHVIPSEIMAPVTEEELNFTNGCLVCWHFEIGELVGWPETKGAGGIYWKVLQTTILYHCPSGYVTRCIPFNVAVETRGKKNLYRIRVEVGGKWALEGQTPPFMMYNHKTATDFTRYRSFWEFPLQPARGSNNSADKQQQLAPKPSQHAQQPSPYARTAVDPARIPPPTAMYGTQQPQQHVQQSLLAATPTNSLVKTKVLASTPPAGELSQLSDIPDKGPSGAPYPSVASPLLKGGHEGGSSKKDNTAAVLRANPNYIPPPAQPPLSSVPTYPSPLQPAYSPHYPPTKQPLLASPYSNPSAYPSPYVTSSPSVYPPYPPYPPPPAAAVASPYNGRAPYPPPPPAAASPYLTPQQHIPTSTTFAPVSSSSPNPKHTTTQQPQQPLQQPLLSSYPTPPSSSPPATQQMDTTQQQPQQRRVATPPLSQGSKQGSPPSILNSQPSAVTESKSTALNWGVEDVLAWLRRGNFEEYVNCFKEQKIDGRVLKDLGDPDLRELGVTKMGDRKRMIQDINDLFVVTS